MTTDVVTEPGERAVAVGCGRQQPYGFAAAQGGRPLTTTVPVLPLWERPREGVCR
ncbi:hypothetical protein [Streptomyces lanatus]|uniref:Uncharacterized protein n=1 Tax=Streptomyces lanatus TaxID=66900 RepID=A0ABV1XUV5_9ACTN|nr:hypothetical protein [Streptomyces lanatus]GHH13301.1 hypothetical protein GCM10018780_52860 [Streptomyces lanatus]